MKPLALLLSLALAGCAMRRPPAPSPAFAGQCHVRAVDATGAPAVMTCKFNQAGAASIWVAAPPQPK